MIPIAAHPSLDLARAARFDVICAGEALWALGVMGGGAMGLRPSGGAVNAALSLARRGLRVGLAAALSDDAQGRALVARVKAAGVDTGGVVLAAPRPSLVLVEAIGEGRRVVPYRIEDDPPVAVPEQWAARVLLVSGLTPALARAAALCKSARAARRAGTMVVVDVNARRHMWAGSDPRAIRAAVKEADVVRSSTEDLAALGIDAARLRSAMREDATLVLTHGAGPARAMGPFGEIALGPPEVRRRTMQGAGDAFTAAVCAELAKAGDPGPDRAPLWERALQQGHAAAQARMASA